MTRMNAKYFGYYIVSAIIIVLFCVGCSNDDDNGNGEDNFPTNEEIQEVLARQMSYYRQFQEFLATMDTSSAKDSIISIIRQDTLVDWVISTSQGINIGWKIMDGGFFIKSARKTSWHPIVENGFDKHKDESFRLLPRPRKFGAIFAAPTMAEFAMAI